MILTKQFEISNVANNPANNLWIPDGHEWVETIEFSKTLKCVLFRSENTLRLSFSSFTFQTIFNFINVGFQLLQYQNIVTVDDEKNIGMNAFFSHWASRFLERTTEYIVDFLAKNENAEIVLQGMSMGGAMSQCFYYYLMNSDIRMGKSIVRVVAFGSPRVGNSQLREWFAEQRFIVNYAICIPLDGKVMGDPVCYFPSAKLGYSNNHNMTHMNEKNVYNGDFHNSASDTDVNFKNFLSDLSFIKKDDLRVWCVVHTFEEYMKHL